MRSAGRKRLTGQQEQSKEHATSAVHVIGFKVQFREGRLVAWKLRRRAVAAQQLQHGASQQLLACRGRSVVAREGLLRRALQVQVANQHAGTQRHDTSSEHHIRAVREIASRALGEWIRLPAARARAAKTGAGPGRAGGQGRRGPAMAGVKCRGGPS